MSDRLIIRRFINSPVSSNCYIISDRMIPDCLVVDPGSEDISGLLEHLRIGGLTPSKILLTHEHFDHVWGVEALRNLFKPEVVATGICSEKITQPKKNFSLFYDQKGFACRPADILITSPGQVLQWHSREIKFLPAPGHSPGGLCFSIENNLFTGDTLLHRIETVTKLPGGNKESLDHTLNEIARLFDGPTWVFPGHGARFRLSESSIMKNRIP
jgi:hydroxyacylglutathione hydrolase